MGMEVYVPDRNLGISRSDMPQISSKDVPEFIKWLASNGVKVSRRKAHADSLSATQKEINQSKVEALASKPSNRGHLEKPVIISRDNYLMDGHHRWMALLTMDKDAVIPVVQVNLKIRDLLTMANNFGGVQRKDLVASILKIAHDILD